MQITNKPCVMEITYNSIDGWSIGWFPQKTTESINRVNHQISLFVSCCETRYFFCAIWDIILQKWILFVTWCNIKSSIMRINCTISHSCMHCRYEQIIVKDKRNFAAVDDPLLHWNAKLILWNSTITVYINSLYKAYFRTINTKAYFN